MLYHPEFLRDIYNFIVHSWQANAQIILIKLAQRMAQRWSSREQPLPQLSFRQQPVI